MAANKSEVSDPIFKPRSWTERLDWAEVFPQSQPIEVDLGCGKGTFLVQAAKSLPGRNFLGVERLLGRARKAAKLIEREKLSNARILRIEVHYAVQYLFPDESIATYHIYFPDPWPKRRHHRRRLLTTEFAGALARTLQKGGAVNLATDFEEYFHEIAKIFAALAWQSARPAEWIGLEWQTDFEREFLAEGRPIFRARFVKNA